MCPGPDLALCVLFTRHGHRAGEPDTQPQAMETSLDRDRKTTGHRAQRVLRASPRRKKCILANPRTRYFLKSHKIPRWPRLLPGQRD